MSELEKRPTSVERGLITFLLARLGTIGLCDVSPYVKNLCREAHEYAASLPPRPALTLTKRVKR
jgi:hypothetical protein